MMLSFDVLTELISPRGRTLPSDFGMEVLVPSITFFGNCFKVEFWVI